MTTSHAKRVALALTGAAALWACLLMLIIEIAQYVAT
jgi:hypothetical protein